MVNPSGESRRTGTPVQRRGRKAEGPKRRRAHGSQLPNRGPFCIFRQKAVPGQAWHFPDEPAHPPKDGVAKLKGLNAASAGQPDAENGERNHPNENNPQKKRYRARTHLCSYIRRSAGRVRRGPQFIGLTFVRFAFNRRQRYKQYKRNRLFNRFPGVHHLQLQ